MALTLAQAVKKMEDLGQELAVWREVEEFLKGFVKQEEHDTLKKVITTGEWDSKGLPPASIVVPQGVIIAVAKKVREDELAPREEEIARLQGLSIEEEVEDGGDVEVKRVEEDPVKEQGKQKGVRTVHTKPGRAKPGAAPKGPNPGKKARRLVPKSAGTSSV